MPPVGLVLKEQQLEDVLVYLLTLNTPPKDGATAPAKPKSEAE